MYRMSINYLHASPHFLTTIKQTREFTSTILSLAAFLDFFIFFNPQTCMLSVYRLLFADFICRTEIGLKNKTKTGTGSDYLVPVHSHQHTVAIYTITETHSLTKGEWVNSSPPVQILLLPFWTLSSFFFFPRDWSPLRAIRGQHKCRVCTPELIVLTFSPRRNKAVSQTSRGCIGWFAQKPRMLKAAERLAARNNAAQLTFMGVAVALHCQGSFKQICFRKKK